MIEIDCSEQPLDFAFHPYRTTLVAAGLVDGTIELHDYQELLQSQFQQQPSKSPNNNNNNSHPKNCGDDNDDNNDDDDDVNVDDDIIDDDNDDHINEDENDDDDDDDRIDTIISSTVVHTRSMMGTNVTSINEHQRSASCRAILFSSSSSSSSSGENNGGLLYSGGTGGDIYGINVERMAILSSKPLHVQDCTVFHIPIASQSAIHVLYELGSSTTGSNNNDHHPSDSSTSISSSKPILVSGDETGGVRLWDIRQCGIHTKTTSRDTTMNGTKQQQPVGCIMGWKKHCDYISGFVSGPNDTLIASSADGRISIYDLRMASEYQYNICHKEKFVTLGDDTDDEILSLCLIKNHSKIVCGTTEGIINVMNYGQWERGVVHRFTALQNITKSIDTIIPWEENGRNNSNNNHNNNNNNIVLTGTDDGYIRVVSIQPDKVLGILNPNSTTTKTNSTSSKRSQYKEEYYPIEKLLLNCNRSYVGSLTHDNIIRLYDTSILRDNDDDDDDMNTKKNEQRQSDSNGNKNSQLHINQRLADTLVVPLQQQQQQLQRDSDDEWDDMDDEDEKENDDVGDDDDDDDVKGADGDDNDEDEDDEDIAMKVDDDDDSDGDDDDDDDDDEDSEEEKNHSSHRGGGSNSGSRSNRIGKRFQSDHERFFEDL